MAKSSGGSYFTFTAVPSWIVSTIVHVILLLLLALFTFQLPSNRKPPNILVLSDTAEVPLDFAEFQADVPTENEIDTDDDLTTAGGDRKRLVFGVNFRPLEETVLKFEWLFDVDDRDNPANLPESGFVIEFSSYF